MKFASVMEIFEVFDVHCSMLIDSLILGDEVTAPLENRPSNCVSANHIGVKLSKKIWSLLLWLSVK